MRLLHTSDWHLGRTFHRESLLDAQAQFIDFLIDVVTGERIDVVMVSGDLFDRALPPVEAVQLASDALRRLTGAGARVVAISGNHDSPRRLGFASDLIDAAGVHLRTDPRHCATPVLLTDDHGPVAFYAVPYLEPGVVADALAADPASHDSVLTAAMTRIRADLAGRRSTRSVVLAHAFVAGAQPSDSERDITVGGVSVVPAPTFAGADYVALGHLHGRQPVTDTIRYSGSPLAYSFSEAQQTKGTWVVELGPRGVVRVDAIDAPIPRRVGQLRDHLDELLTNPAFAAYEDRWLQITLTDQVRPAAPMERLRARFPHALVLVFEPEGVHPGAPSTYTERIRDRSDLDVAIGFVEHVRHRPAAADERALLADAFAAARAGEVAG